MSKTQFRNCQKHKVIVALDSSCNLKYRVVLLIKCGDTVMLNHNIRIFGW